MTILNVYSAEVQDSWTDHYGHMNEGYYVVAFSDASWALQAELGIGTDYFDVSGMAMMTVESHIRYLDGAYRGDTIVFDSMVIDADAKRVHVGHVARLGDTVIATFECLLLHFDMKNEKTAPMPEEIQERLAGLVMDPRPDWAGSTVGIRRKG